MGSQPVPFNTVTVHLSFNDEHNGKGWELVNAWNEDWNLDSSPQKDMTSARDVNGKSDGGA